MSNRYHPAVVQSVEAVPVPEPEWDGNPESATDPSDAARLPDAIDVILEHLEHDPEVSHAAISLYEEILRRSEQDGERWMTLESLAPAMDATLSTMDEWRFELQWSGVIFRGWDEQQRAVVRLADADEMRALNIRIPE